MELIQAIGIEKAWGERMVLHGVDLSVKVGERIGLVGANGSGKSTLLAILAGIDAEDHGKVLRYATPGILVQDPKLPGKTVQDAADEALSWHRRWLEAFERATQEGDSKEAVRLQNLLDQHGWEVGHRVASLLDRLKAPPGDAEIARLSGGELRRVALARALLGSPDLLLLDEPTNHLDAETVEWLQDYLGGFRGGLVIVTHDRYLLEAVATRIVEIEDGKGFAYEGSYGDYLIGRAERQALLRRERDTKMSMIEQEAAWAAKSPAARSTKQKARLQRLDVLRDSVPTVRDATFTLDFRTGEKLGRTLMEGRGLKKGYGGRTLIAGLDFDLRPGQRIGILGPNGCGKSTLLRMLSGEEQPDAGTLHRGPRVRVAVLDQHRTGLSETDTVFEAAGGGNDQVIVNDQPVHVASFLGRFLFSRDSFEQRVSGLSGGEKARILLAKLLLQGANLILLDEPTNDLDLMTLRVLEEALLAFDGAVVVVTHDRAFLDRTCTGMLAFEGNGAIVSYASRTQYMAALAARQAEAAPVKKVFAIAPKVRTNLSNKERQELDGLPARIEALEAEQAAIEAQLADPETYRGGKAEVAGLNAKLAAVAADMDAAFARWEALEARK